MITLDEYLLNPCGTLSIPYWKNKVMKLPESMKIVHHDNFNNNDLVEYEDERYFRLYHSLENIDGSTPEGFCVVTAQPNDIEQIVDIINQSYSDLSTTVEQITGYTKTVVYEKDLWILIFDCKTNFPIGCGMADFDKEAREGILEWIQVLPDYRGKGIGQFIVNQLLSRMIEKASFATVSGKINNATNPEMLYRKCGFVGNDVWHILYAK